MIFEPGKQYISEEAESSEHDAEMKINQSCDTCEKGSQCNSSDAIRKLVSTNGCVSYRPKIDGSDITVVNMPDIKQVQPLTPVLDRLTLEEWKDLQKKIEPKLHHGDYTLELLDMILELPEDDSERKYYDSEGLTASSIVSITHVRDNVFMVFWRC